ncbi:MAG TPA: hypothetical protein VIJ15_10750 [Dermatophilaceae bacterium]
MKTKLGWSMATLAILTFAAGQASATAAGQLITPKPAASTETLTSAMSDPPCGQGPTSPVPTPFTDPVGQPAVAAADSTNHYPLSAHLDTHVFNSAWGASRKKLDLPAGVPTLGYDAVKADGKTVLSLHCHVR